MLQAVHGWSSTYERLVKSQNFFSSYLTQEDLSRLGRNYVMTGQYTDIYFPSHNVRFIAIADGVDSNKGESEIAPFLNILNEMHARQTSKKVKAALHTKFVNGAHYGAYPPIGYIKDPDQKGHLIPDTDYMWIVEKIFDLAAHGNGGAKIRRLLEEAEVPTPSWINYQRYGTFAHNIKKTECQLAESGEKKWRFDLKIKSGTAVSETASDFRFISF